MISAAAVVVGAVALVRFFKNKKKNDEPSAAATTTAEAQAEAEANSFTADESKFMNYVDEGFMGFTANDEFMMLGGGKPIEFADFAGHKTPINTDEPNFAYANGKKIIPPYPTPTPTITPTGSGGSKGRGRITRPSRRVPKGTMDIETGESTPTFKRREKYAKIK